MALVFLTVGFQAPFVSGTAEAQCTSPAFTTTDPNGGWSDGGYYVHNNMWNSQATLGPETLYACSYKNWYVDSKQTNEAGAVKTYPNVHKDYSNAAISSFNYLTTAFAATSPHAGIYDVAYDIWLNGVATAGCTEVMIWTENYNQVPAGNKVDTVTLGGMKCDVWKANGSSTYIAFVPKSPVTSGTIDLHWLFNWIIAKGWIPANSTIGQICFGVEIVSTNNATARFTFTEFSINTSPPAVMSQPGARGIMAAASCAVKKEYFSLSGKRLECANNPERARNRIFIYRTVDKGKTVSYGVMVFR
jgi:hypothetical protein